LLGHNPFLAGQISIMSYLYKIPPPHPRMVFTYQTSTFSRPLFYMQPQTQCRKSGTHGAAATFGTISITFVHTTIASVLHLQIRLNFNTYLSYEVDEIEACDLVDSHNNTS